MSVRYVPAEQRDSYPAHWVAIYGWRQIVAYTPRVGLRSLMVTLRFLPRFGGAFFGVWAGRDDDDHIEVRVGIGAAEVQFDVIEWWPADRKPKVG